MRRSGAASALKYRSNGSNGSRLRRLAQAANLCHDGFSAEQYR
jgi:hypothetical protein